VQLYEPGSAGPAAADQLVQRYGHAWNELTKH
jgi:glucose-6-phosphate 1-dehydrogenase